MVHHPPVGWTVAPTPNQSDITHRAAHRSTSSSPKPEEPINLFGPNPPRYDPILPEKLFCDPAYNPYPQIPPL